MRYIKVEWLQSNPDYPVELYSEIDEEGWELRKVEIFRDCHAGFADRLEEHGTTRLSVEPLPTIEEIASDSQFRPVEISHHTFEEVWATHGPGSHG
jgi:hypothetical protein